MDLLTNAVESIQVGVADYGEGTRPRLLSSVRNIHAGILLLYKEALRRRSPRDSNEALVKLDLRPSGMPGQPVGFVGVGRRTVNAQIIEQRFKGLGIRTDWKRFRRISDIRNDVEHYYPSITPESLKDLVASAFYLIKTFLADELKEDPVATLGTNTWNAMLAVAEVFESERKACDTALDGVDWGSARLGEGVRLIRCADCGSELLRPVGGTELDSVELRCNACGSVVDADTFVPAAIAEALSFESYLVLDDGADEPIVECPECSLVAYVVEDDHCARCGSQVDRITCSRCGKTVPIDEMDSAPLCSYCDYVMSNDD